MIIFAKVIANFLVNSENKERTDGMINNVVFSSWFAYRFKTLHAFAYLYV